MGRRKFNPTSEQRAVVSSLAAVGTQQQDIAKLIGIRSPKTLRLHFRKELDLAAINANANVAGSVYKSAMSGNVGAMDLWLRNRAGWGSARSTPAQAQMQQPPPFIVRPEELPAQPPLPEKEEQED